MKRMVCLQIACLMVLTAVSSPASARGSYFTFRGHRIHLHAVRHCRSLSCLSLSIPGIHWRRGRDRDAGDVANSAEPAQMPAPVQAQPSPPPLPAQPQTQPAPLIAQTAPVPVTRTPTAPAQIRPVPAPALAAVAPTAQVAPPASKPTVQVTNSTLPAPPSVGFDVAKPQDGPAQKPAVPAASTAGQAAPEVTRASQESDEEAIDTPVGDWQTEGKGGLVRIEACGEALCGYVLNASTRAKGETVLVNMKAKNVTQWTGNIYSRSSGNSYFGTMTLKEVNTLRVEACAVGKFFCSGNNWTRIGEGGSIGSNEMATSRRHVAGARS
jgi:uncharacterized protein (DUF2147 family)